MAFPLTRTEGLTDDGFLGGRISILQPDKGYRAGVDPVFLAASVPARPGDRVLDLGCGVGTAALCLGARVPGLALSGIERQPEYADLARENTRRNGLDLIVHTGDISGPPAELRALSFDHVIANPPYFEANARTGATEPGREAALAEETPLAAWVDTAIRRLAPKGRVTMILAAERLPDLLAALDRRVGSIAVHPLSPRVGRPASRVIVTALKGARGAFGLAAPTVLHDGDRHEADRESYTPEIAAVLRDGAAMPWLEP